MIQVLAELNLILDLYLLIDEVVLVFQSLAFRQKVFLLLQALAA